MSKKRNCWRESFSSQPAKVPRKRYFAKKKEREILAPKRVLRLLSVTIFTESQSGASEEVRKIIVIT